MQKNKALVSNRQKQADGLAKTFLVVLLLSMIALSNTSTTTSTICKTGCNECKKSYGDCLECQIGYILVEDSCHVAPILQMIPLYTTIAILFLLITFCVAACNKKRQVRMIHCEMMRQLHNSFRKDKVAESTKLVILKGSTVVAPKNSFSCLVTSSHLY